MRTKTMRVCAAAGVALPIPARVAINTSARYFPESGSVEVFADHYFVIKRLRSGDLVVVADRAPKKQAASAKAPKAKKGEDA